MRRPSAGASRRFLAVWSPAPGVFTKSRSLIATRRFGAVILFIFNIMAVISYPDLNIPGLKDHQLWGFMLAVLVFYGPGKLSVDHFLVKKFGGS